MNASDPSKSRIATPHERVVLARLLARFAAASGDEREIVEYVAAALHELAAVLDRDRHPSEASVLRRCATRLEAASTL